MKQDDISKEAWLSEPFTQHMAEKLKQTEWSRLEDLKTACRKSSDPLVVAKFSRWESAHFMSQLFAKGEFNDG